MEAKSSHKVWFLVRSMSYLASKVSFLLNRQVLFIPFSLDEMIRNFECKHRYVADIIVYHLQQNWLTSEEYFSTGVVFDFCRFIPQNWSLIQNERAFFLFSIASKWYSLRLVGWFFPNNLEWKDSLFSVSIYTWNKKKIFLKIKNMSNAINTETLSQFNICCNLFDVFSVFGIEILQITV